MINFLIFFFLRREDKLCVHGLNELFFISESEQSATAGKKNFVVTQVYRTSSAMSLTLWVCSTGAVIKIIQN